MRLRLAKAELRIPHRILPTAYDSLITVDRAAPVKPA